MKFKTKKVNGIEITLIAGVRYRASRPMAERGMKTFPVTIRPTCDQYGMEDALAVVVDGLNYDQANDMLMAFNNDEDGRTW